MKCEKCGYEKEYRGDSTETVIHIIKAGAIAILGYLIIKWILFNVAL